jgi:hypothetical protein
LQPQLRCFRRFGALLFDQYRRHRLAGNGENCIVRESDSSEVGIEGVRHR